MKSMTGGCLCGSVKYESTGNPTHPTLCHCSSCRRASGSHVLGWVTFQMSEFRFTAGPPAEYRSSKSVVRTFCGTCGTPLTYRHDALPETIDVTIGSLHPPDATPPADHVWMSDAVAWDKPADGLPQYQTSRVE